MEVRNCANCGRIFNYTGGKPICQVCREHADEAFQQVKEYVRENPGATINMVAEVNDVSPKQIKQWVKEERLQFADDSPVVFQCEKCGKNIKTGRFCNECKDKRMDAFSRSIARPKKEAPAPKKTTSPSDKMRFI